MQTKCSQCKKQLSDDMLFALCCVQHQYCVKCTAKLLNKKSKWSNCYCCQRKPILWHSNVPYQKGLNNSITPKFVGPVQTYSATYFKLFIKNNLNQCNNITPELFHNLDHICFIKSTHIDVYAFPIDFIINNYVSFNYKQNTQSISKTCLKQIEKETPIYKIQVPIVFGNINNHNIQEQFEQTSDLSDNIQQKMLIQEILQKDFQKMTKIYQKYNKVYEQNFISDQILSDNILNNTDNQGFATQFAKNEVFSQLKYLVSSLISNVLNSVGVAKQVNSQALVELIIRSRNYLQDHLTVPYLFGINMYNTQDKLTITLIEKKTNQPILYT